MWRVGCCRFKEVVDSRVRKGNSEELAATLRAMSPGRAPSMWARVRSLPMPCLCLAASFDPKFAGIALRLAAAWGAQARHGDGARPPQGSSHGDQGTLTAEGGSTTSCTCSSTAQSGTGGESSTPGQRGVLGRGSTVSQPGSPERECDVGDSGFSEMHHGIATARAVVVGGCGHALHIESPLAVVHEILRFLASSKAMRVT